MSECERFYKSLEMPFNYTIDKNLLKKKYFDVVKKNKHSTELINNAYNTLKDDYLRALSFKEHFFVNSDTNNLDKIKNSLLATESTIEFDKNLDDFLNLQEQILQNTQNKEKLKEIDQILTVEIEKCKNNYKNVSFLNKWSYLRKIQNILKEYL